MEQSKLEQEIIKRATHPSGCWRNFYQPVWGFPHFAPNKITNADARLGIISSHCDFNKRFFVGGSNVGYTAFTIVKNGGLVVGVDSATYEHEFSKLLAKYNGFVDENPLFIKKSILQYLHTNDQEFDYAILLMVFHHMWRKETDAFKALNLLAERSPIIIMQCRPKKWTPEDIPGYIIKNSILKSYEQISTNVTYTHMSVPIYKFYG